MKIDVPKDRITRLVGVLAALNLAYPARKHDLADVIDNAPNGLTITVEPLEFDHTIRQRGYYHLWKKRFAEFTGNTPDEMHEHLLGEAFGTEIVDTMLGQIVRPLRRSSEAKRVEYSVLIDTLIRVAADMGFVVPPPVTEMH